MSAAHGPLTEMAAPERPSSASVWAEVEASVTQMARVGMCHSPTFSPDGSRLAFVSNLSGLPQVWTVAVDGGWPEQITALDDPVDTVRWSPDGAWLAFSVAPGGGMNAQAYVMRPDGSGMRRLTRGGRENNWLGPWARDGSMLAIASNQDRPAAMDVYLVDPGSGDTRLVVRNQGVGYLTDISRDRRFGILFRAVYRGDSDLFLVDLQDGTETLLTPHEGPGDSPRGQFSPDGRTVYLSSNTGRDLMAFARIRLDAAGRPGTMEVLAAREDSECHGFEVREDGTLAALLWNVDGASEITFLDLETMAERAGPSLPSEAIAGITFARDGRLLAINATGAAAPRDIWAYNLASEELKQVTHSPHPGVDPGALIKPEVMRFRAHDGLALSGWLYRPRSHHGPGPTVLSFHGGPEYQELPIFNPIYQALLAQGIAVFAPNVRGSTGFGKAFVHLDNGPLRVNAVRDIKASVDCVVHAGVADPRRIGIMGGSYGGFMTMAGLTEFPELFAAGANLFGVVNFETFFAHTEPWMAAVSKVEYGDPETQADLLRSLSPIHKVDRARAPLLVLHGANDTNVPVVEAEQVVEGVRTQGVPVEYILFPDEGHGFRKTSNRVRASVAIVRWFATHLTGRPAPERRQQAGGGPGR